MLAWRRLTPCARRHHRPSGARGASAPARSPPRAATPLPPAPHCAPAKSGCLGPDSSTALHLPPPPVAAGLAPRRRAEKGQREEPAPSPPGTATAAVPSAPPPFPGAAATAPLPLLPLVEQGPARRRDPGRGQLLPLPPATGVKGHPGPLRSSGWASPPPPPPSLARSRHLPRGASPGPAGRPGAPGPPTPVLT